MQIDRFFRYGVLLAVCAGSLSSLAAVRVYRTTSERDFREAIDASPFGNTLTTVVIPKEGL